MSKCVGHDIALGLALKAVVADGRGRLHGGFDVAGLKNTPLRLGIMRPYSCKTIGLQLDSDLKLIGFNPIYATLQLLHARQDAQQILHVVTNFMGDHIGLRKLAALTPYVATPEPQLKIPKKCGVEIDLSIIRTIEGSHRGLRISTSRKRSTSEHRQRRRFVGASCLRKYRFPLHLCASEHGRNELSHGISWSCHLRLLRDGLRLLASAQTRYDFRAANQVQWIDAQCPADKAKKDDRANSDAATAANGKAACSIPASIFYPVAAWQFIKTHSSSTPVLADIALLSLIPRQFDAGSL